MDNNDLVRGTGCETISSKYSGNRIVKAKQSKPCAQLTNGQIGDLVLWVRATIGSKSELGATEMIVIASSIRENLRNFTVDEVKLAFDLAIGGSLKYEIPQYPEISTRLFVGIMNAYVEYKRNDLEYRDYCKEIEAQKHKLSDRANKIRSRLEDIDMKKSNYSRILKWVKGELEELPQTFVLAQWYNLLLDFEVIEDNYIHFGDSMVAREVNQEQLRLKKASTDRDVQAITSGIERIQSKQSATIVWQCKSESIVAQMKDNQVKKSAVDMEKTERWKELLAEYQELKEELTAMRNEKKA